MARARTAAKRTVRCYLCGHLFDVSAKTLSTPCPHCNRALKVEDVVVKSYLPVNNLQTCGRITITKRGRVAAKCVQSGEGIICDGTIEGCVETDGEVALGPKATWKGESLQCRRLKMAPGAVINGRLNIPWIRNEVPPTPVERAVTRPAVSPTVEIRPVPVVPRSVRDEDDLLVPDGPPVPVDERYDDDFANDQPLDGSSNERPDSETSIALVGNWDDEPSDETDALPREAIVEVKPATPVRKTVAKKASTRKTVTKKTSATSAKKTVTKRTTKKTTASKTATKKTVTKKKVTRKTVTKKAPAAKKVTRKTTTASKATTKKTTAKKSTAKKVATKKTTSKKAPAKKTPTKKTAAKKSASKKAPTRKKS